MSEGLEWTTPNALLDEDADVAKINVFPQYLPAGDIEDSIELVIGKGKKTGTPLSVSIHRVVLEKKVEKMVTLETLHISISLICFIRGLYMCTNG